MDNKKHRSIQKSPVKKLRGSSVSKTDNGKKKLKEDQYLAVWILTKLGWSNRRIARLKLPASWHTVSDYYAEACEQIETGKLPIIRKSRSEKEFYAGTSEDVAYLNAKANQNICGGGRKVNQISDDYEGTQKYYKKNNNQPNPRGGTKWNTKKEK